MWRSRSALAICGSTSTPRLVPMLSALPRRSRRVCRRLSHSMLAERRRLRWSRDYPMYLLAPSDAGSDDSIEEALKDATRRRRGEQGRTTMLPVKIAGLGWYLPEQQVTNATLAH